MATALEIWFKNHKHHLTQEAIDEALMEYITHIESTAASYKQQVEEMSMELDSLKEGDEILRAVAEQVEDVKYVGTYADGVIELRKQLAAAQAEIERLSQENMRLKVDAERYRWLRDSDYNTYPAVFRAQQGWTTLRYGALDQAIDAARQGEKEDGK